jgi:hypothetical protein
MKDKRIIKQLPILNNKANTLQVELYYSKGGMNYFTGTNERRGLYLSVSPLEIKEYEGGGRSIGYVGFSGTKKCVKEMARFNQKQFDNFVVDENDIEPLMNHVIKQNNLEVVKEAAVK